MDYQQRLAAYLAERDFPCPGCGYNLRGVTRGACPECGVKLNIRCDPPEEAAPPPSLEGVDYRDRLAVYLAERDFPCPGCGYNLRGAARGVCPECGHRLHIQCDEAWGSGAERPRWSGLFIAAIVGLALPMAAVYAAPWTLLQFGFAALFGAVAISLVHLVFIVLLIRNRPWFESRPLETRVCLVLATLYWILIVVGSALTESHGGV